MVTPHIIFEILGPWRIVCCYGFHIPKSRANDRYILSFRLIQKLSQILFLNSIPSCRGRLQRLSDMKYWSQISPISLFIMHALSGTCDSKRISLNHIALILIRCKSCCFFTSIYSTQTIWRKQFIKKNKAANMTKNECSQTQNKVFFALKIFDSDEVEFDVLFGNCS